MPPGDWRRDEGGCQAYDVPLCADGNQSPQRLRACQKSWIRVVGVPIDLDDTEWSILEALPAAKLGGRPEEYSKREIVNAILYVLRTGCAWRFVLNDLLLGALFIIPFGAGVKTAPGNGAMRPSAVTDDASKGGHAMVQRIAAKTSF